MIIGFIGAVLFAVVFAAAVIFAEPALLEGVVAPATGVEIQGWLDEFVRSQVYAVAVAAVLAIGWHVIAYYSSGRRADRRLGWVLVWIVGLLCSWLLCALLLPATQEGGVWAYALASLNGALPFWLGTVWCTTGACKYAPLGAGRMRSVLGL